jgi:hypothetical protein
MYVLSFGPIRLIACHNGEKKNAVQQSILQRRRTSAKTTTHSEQKMDVSSTKRTRVDTSEQIRLSPPFGTIRLIACHGKSICLNLAQISGNVLEWLESLKSELSHRISNRQSILKSIIAHLMEVGLTTSGALCH